MKIETRRLWQKVAAAVVVGGAVGGGVALTSGGSADPGEPPVVEIATGPAPIEITQASIESALPAETPPPPLAPVPSTAEPKVLPPEILKTAAVIPAVAPVAPQPETVAPAAAVLPFVAPRLPPLPSIPELPAAPAPLPTPTAQSLPLAPPPKESAKSGLAVPVYRPSDPQPLFPIPVPMKPESALAALPDVAPTGRADNPPAPIPPLAMPAPPAPPAKSTGLAKPVPAVQSDFNLRPGYAGHSVKMESSAGGPKPVAAPFAESPRAEFSHPLRPGILATAPGDHPMTLRQTALAALIGGACALASEASAAYPVPPLPVAPTSPVVQDAGKDTTKDKSVEQRLEKIEKQLAEFAEILKGRRDAQDFPIESDPGLVAELKNLRDEVAGLRKQLDEMKKTTALRPTTPGTGIPGAAVPAAPAMGTVLIINEYPVEITMMINDRTYRVAPRTELKVQVPVGEFTYQLLNSGAALTPTRAVITEKEPIKLRVR